MNSQHVTIIAEAGVNHNGSIENALKLIDVAAEAGVDYIKFQTFNANKLVSGLAKKANYQLQNTRDPGESQFQMLQKLELSHEQHDKLISYCNKKGVNFFSTAFDIDSLEYLHQIGLQMVKIPSGEITNLPYLRKAASLFQKVILSTGMSTIEEIKDAVDIFTNAGINKDDITILHCNTEYPTPMEDVNLRAMLYIQQVFKTKVGYSDHTLGIEVPIAAVALGASIIEKHFTLDKTLKGPDHSASLEPEELKAMVLAIRNIEKTLSGSGVKEVSRSEQKNISVARKSIVATKKIQKGDIFTEENIGVKRPGTGISPMKWDEVIGKVSPKSFDVDDLITLE